MRPRFGGNSSKLLASTRKQFHFGLKQTVAQGPQQFARQQRCRGAGSPPVGGEFSSGPAACLM